MENKDAKELGIGAGEKAITPIEFIARTTEKDLRELGVDTIVNVMNNELIRCHNCGAYDEEQKKCDWHEIKMDMDDYCSHATRKDVETESIRVYATINDWQ